MYFEIFFWMVSRNFSDMRSTVSKNWINEAMQFFKIHVLYSPLIGLSSTLLIADSSLDCNYSAEAACDFEVVEPIKWPKVMDGCSGMFLVWLFDRGIVDQ